MADSLKLGGWAMADLLSEDLRARLRAAANVVAYTDGKLIHARGDAKPGLSIVQAGAVRLATPDADGSYTTTTILGPGHCFGEATLFTGLPRAYDAVAVGDTVIEQISKLKFDRIFDQEPDLGRCMLMATTRRLYNALEFLEDLRGLPTHVCAAKLIVSLALSSKNNNFVECTQADFAFTLGVSRVSAGLALGMLQDDGVIERGYGRITIPDMARLEAWITDRSSLAPLSSA